MIFDLVLINGKTVRFENVDEEIFKNAKDSMEKGNVLIKNNDVSIDSSYVVAVLRVNEDE